MSPTKNNSLPTLDELQLRFATACDMKHAVDRAKILECMTRWLAGITKEKLAVRFLENFEDAKKVGRDAWDAWAARAARAARDARDARAAWDARAARAARAAWAARDARAARAAWAARASWAAWAAWDATRASHALRHSEKLLELLAAAPVPASAP